MCAEVMLLSNTFIYSGRLKCGTSTVASRRLALPKPCGLYAQHRQVLAPRSTAAANCPGPETSSCWLSRSLSPDQPVVFINTDLISTSLEAQSGSRIINTLEARLITHLTVSLLSLGVPASEIGVIAFYRSQLALLRTNLSSAHTQTQSSELAAPFAAAAAAVELHTADKFQGRDKEVVLVSCVRSNEAGTVGDLLKDRRRVNVALTRARSKLVILGSEKTLSGNELLCDMVGLCREKGWVLDLQSDMVDSHVFDEGVSQTGRTLAKASPMRRQQASRSPSVSPSKRRKALGDITGSSQGNARSLKKRATGKRVPEKVYLAGKRGVLDGRPVLRNIYEEAL